MAARLAKAVTSRGHRVPAHADRSTAEVARAWKAYTEPYRQKAPGGRRGPSRGGDGGAGRVGTMAPPVSAGTYGPRATPGAVQFSHGPDDGASARVINGPWVFSDWEPLD